MRHGRSVSTAIRGFAVCAVGGLVETGLATAAGGAWDRLWALPNRPQAELATALVDLATLTALAAWTWLLVVAALTVVAALPWGRPRLQAVVRRLAPVVTRRALLGLLGVGALVAPAPALAAGAARLDSPHSVASAGVKLGEVQSRAPASLLQGLRLPDRPVGRPTVEPRPEGGRPTTVVVAPGDTLWDIAARSLGPHASPSAIARAWPAWYAANRSAIGDDPDLIVPGTVLRSPPRHALNLPPDERP